MDDEESKLCIEDLEFSVRTSNFLSSIGVNDVESLETFTAGTLRSKRLCGEKVIKEIRERLAFHGLCLAGDIIIQSAAGLSLIKEIPEMINRLQNKLDKLKYDIKDIYLVLEKIKTSQVSK